MNDGHDQRLDALDQRIVAKLARDARTSNRAIAAELGVTEGTIRTRIKRLQHEGLIQFTVISDFRLAGSPNLCMMGIDTDPDQAARLAALLKDMPEINCVVLLLGRYTMLAMGLFTSIEQLHDFVDQKLRGLPGIQNIEVGISVHNLKYEAGVAKITSPQPPLD